MAPLTRSSYRGVDKLHHRRANRYSRCRARFERLDDVFIDIANDKIGHDRSPG